MTALVLCGGGSRGAVEVGLYRALVEDRVDVAGTRWEKEPSSGRRKEGACGAGGSQGGAGR